MAQRGNPRIDLVRGQLATLTRLGALGHLDLEIFGHAEVVAGHAETTRSDLFDFASAIRVEKALW